MFSLGRFEVGAGELLGLQCNLIALLPRKKKRAVSRESLDDHYYERELRTSYNNLVKMGSSSITPTSAEEAITKKNYKLWLKIEVALLSVLIIGVWSLLSLPIIFYYLPISEVRYTHMLQE